MPQNLDYLKDLVAEQKSMQKSGFVEFQWGDRHYTLPDRNSGVYKFPIYQLHGVKRVQFQYIKN